MFCLMPPRTQLALLAARALLTHIQLAISQDAQAPFCSTALQPLVLWSIHTTKAALSQGLLAFEGIDSSSQFSVIGKLTSNSFKSCIQVVNEDVEENWTEDEALQNPTSGRSLA
ncbi:hypothetical protein WISP_101080 [Willisornis vidua]|uniref:Uncharacterized protein n=1 Tax=Willisornis vidua TaxID=1566151 RepID=A0ABQ9CZJ1_9PASS|nr:hypothetical protein WISP_101080 [Willisornis vidua]